MNKRRRIITSGVILLIIIAALAAYFYITKYRARDINIEAAMDTTMVDEPVPSLLYGIPVDSFFIEVGKIRRNQNLIGILNQYSLSEGRLNRLILSSQHEFDLRKIRAGNEYTVFLSKDTLYQLKYLVYSHTPIEYVVFDFTDSLKISVKEKAVRLVEKKASASIETSLWNTMIDNRINPMVAIELSEIYAWTIDFFGLQPEDSFRVIYNEMYVDTASAGIQSIQCAYFRHAGTDFYAIPFVQDSVESFYDTVGNSLRKAFLKAPLRYSRISSRFSNSRMHPILKIRRPHHGVDYAAPIGTPVLAIGDGRVIRMSFEGGAGRMVKIRHNSIYTTAYMHLSGYGKGIHSGGYVKQGDVIGYVGSSGLSTGPHLDFRFYKNNVPVDPLKVEAPPVEPVREENLPAFDSVKAVVLERLNEF